VIFRVYSLTYFICFRFEGFFERNFRLSDYTKNINIQNKYSGRAFVRRGLDTRYNR
jgi:hypothetical protein